MKHLILSLLSATPSPREAQSFIKSYNTPRLGLVSLASGVSTCHLQSFSQTLVHLCSLGLCPWIILDSPSLKRHSPTPTRAFGETRAQIARELDRIALSIQQTGGKPLNLYHGGLEQSSADAQPHLTQVLQKTARELGLIPLVAPILIDPSSRYQLLSHQQTLSHLIHGLSQNSHLPTLARFMLVNERGGLTLETGQPIGFVNLEDEYAHLSQSISAHASDTLRELTLVKSVLSMMPSSSSAIITSAHSSSSLIANLITDKPIASPVQDVSTLFMHHDAPLERPPTVLRHGLQVTLHDSLETLDQPKLWSLLEASFSKKLQTQAFIERLKGSLDRIIIAGDYQGAAIMTREGSFEYLDKFSVDPRAQGIGVADILWKRIKALYPNLFWRSRADNPVNKWYLLTF